METYNAAMNKWITAKFDHFLAGLIWTWFDVSDAPKLASMWHGFCHKKLIFWHLGSKMTSGKVYINEVYPRVTRIHLIVQFTEVLLELFVVQRLYPSVKNLVVSLQSRVFFKKWLKTAQKWLFCYKWSWNRHLKWSTILFQPLPYNYGSPKMPSLF